VLLSSHILAEVEALADRVSIIRRGRTVTSGSLADLRRHTRTAVHAVTDEEPDGLAQAEGTADYAAERLDGRVDLRFTIDAEHLDTVIGRLHAARIQTLTVTPPSLNALFLRSYGETLDATEMDDGTLAEAAR
jgi:ABC-2 type transport system ATP-binding protein